MKTDFDNVAPYAPANAEHADATAVLNVVMAPGVPPADAAADAAAPTAPKNVAKAAPKKAPHMAGFGCATGTFSTGAGPVGVPPR